MTYDDYYYPGERRNKKKKTFLKTIGLGVPEPLRAPLASVVTFFILFILVGQINTMSDIRASVGQGLLSGFFALGIVISLIFLLLRVILNIGDIDTWKFLGWLSIIGLAIYLFSSVSTPSLTNSKNNLLEDECLENLIPKSIYLATKSDSGRLDFPETVSSSYDKERFKDYYNYWKSGKSIDLYLYNFCSQGKEEGENQDLIYCYDLTYEEKVPAKLNSEGIIEQKEFIRKYKISLVLNETEDRSEVETAFGKKVEILTTGVVSAKCSII